MIKVSEIIRYIEDKNLSIQSLNSEITKLSDELNTLVSNNDTYSPKFIEISKALSDKNNLKSLFQSLTKNIDNLKQAIEMSEDTEVAEMAKIEAKDLEEKIENDFIKLKELTATPLPDDEKKAIIEFRPGVGGVEASLFAEELMRIYTKYCNDNKLGLETVSIDYDIEGGIKEAIFLVNEPFSYGKLRFESGVNRIQRIPKTESMGRIHTSTASIVVMPQSEIKDMKIDPQDLRIDVYRSGGPGGQSVNTTDSAVRVTHIPSGIVVSCQAGKSQHKNKELALSILQSKLDEREKEKFSNQVSEIRESSINGANRSSKIRTYNFGQSRVTDHRIGKSWFNLEDIFSGNIGPIIEELSRELRKESI